MLIEAQAVRRIAPARGSSQPVERIDPPPMPVYNARSVSEGRDSSATTVQETMTKTAAKKTTGKSAAASKTAKKKPAAQMTEEDIRAMSDDDYMNAEQLEFFRLSLLKMREEVLAREMDVKARLNARESYADPADRASAEEEHWLDLRLRERESLLLRKVDEALRRIMDGEYGYCEETGEPIGIPRLLARPTATVCVDVKGHNEQIEAQYRDR